MLSKKAIKILLDKKVEEYNSPSFIPNDPISIPHRFTKKQDIEIAGFFAAIFAWGQRVTIINKCLDLLQRMDNSPHDFVLNHTETDLLKLLNFKHRTFNDTDLLYAINFFHQWYTTNNSLEDAFAMGMKKTDETVENGLNYFRKTFFTGEFVPSRTQKHIASPKQKSACKRINMYLRWMVRKDSCGVDFGLWNKIKPSQLVCPLDVHVNSVAIEMGLLTNTKSNWQAAIELTQNLKLFDKADPVKYDFALFGIGVNSEVLSY